MGKDETTIANLGDSRAYTYDRREGLKKVTTDDTGADKIDVIEAFKKWGIPEEDYRFFVWGNGIENYLGSTNAEPTIYTLSNDEYRYLILLTDGVTKCLTRKQIETIIKQGKPDRIAKEIVDKAISTDAVRSKATEESDKNGLFFEGYRAGCDNTTVTLLDGEER